ncbi:hypothetical protein H6786_00410 [Candidatus Nomurabacteria bacterium]|nr:hypothetical protein [Candidatus Nomurabacteria bacterium]
MTFDPQLILLFINTVAVIFVIALFLTKNDTARNGDAGDIYERIKNDIKFTFEPMVDIPLGVEEIVDLAVEVWRMEQRLSKASENIPEIHQRSLSNSINRLKSYLNKYDVEIHDYTGQKYNDGLNFDILSREQDPTLESPIVKETVEPTITCRGKVVKRAKIILASNQK